MLQIIQGGVFIGRNNNLCKKEIKLLSKESLTQMKGSGFVLGKVGVGRAFNIKKEKVENL
ncbi:hypothetical protein [Clostridium saccharoperbutylacetonicum]|uniref:hypothetical protein n=1 Tax=Clostridium saccharoperbutylacetonicum TaxID=36745 RepID=UPI0039EB5F68